MTRIVLHFTDAERPELTRIYFLHRVLPDEILCCARQDRRCFRQVADISVDCCSEGAVSAAAGNRGQSSAWLQKGQPGMQRSPRGGNGNSRCLTDAVLGRGTDWLLDVFGTDALGRPLSQRLFKRSNPERKRPGPVAVSLNVAAWESVEILVFVGSVQLHDAPAFFMLAERIRRTGQAQPLPVLGIDRDWTEAEPANGSALREEDALAAMIRRLLEEEVRLGLCTTNIFQRASLNRTTELIHSGLPFQRVAGGRRELLHRIDTELTANHRLGLADSEAYLRKMLCRNQPIRVALGVPGAAVTALFYYLSLIKGYHFELNINHVHAVEIARKLLRHEYQQLPDLCAVGVAPAATLLGRQRHVEFMPLMILPKTTKQIVVVQKKKNNAELLSFGEYVFIDDDPSVPSFFFEELCGTGRINSSVVCSHHMEPDETLSYLREGNTETRAILFFPHYHVNKIFNNCLYVPAPCEVHITDQMLLFGERLNSRDRELVKCIDIALRDAWLELSMNQAVLSHVIDLMVPNPCYQRVFARSAGLYSLGGG